MKTRNCSRCGKPGHRKSTCVEIEREEAKKAKEEPDRLEIDGVVPKKGLWVLHEKKEIIVGKIRKITPTGEIHYTNPGGCQIFSKQENFLKGGYTYRDLEPEHLKWKMGLC
jgi:hypothetical protein